MTFILIDWLYHPLLTILRILLAFAAVYVVVRLVAIAWYKTRQEYENDYYTKSSNRENEE